MPEVVTDVVCPFCGCLCDDLEVVVENGKIVEVRNACSLGTAKFLSAQKEDRIRKPYIRKNGKFVEVSLEEAINKAAEILVNANRPLLYGWSSTECEAHRVGIMLAEELGAVIDNTASVCHGPSIIAVQEIGLSGCTLGQVKNRADLIIYWGSNPSSAHPRHLSRYTMFCRGFFRDKGAKERTLIVVDVRRTDTAKLADYFVQVKPGGDYELIQALRYAIKTGDLDKNEVSGVPRDLILKIAELMKSCHFGALFFGLGLTMSKGKHRNIDAALSLVRDLNRYTKFVLMPMRGHYNVTGFNTVSTWMTGYPFSVDFSRGYPRYNPGEYSAVDVLLREECDAALIVASDPVSHFPRKATEHLARIPLIVIDPHWTPTAMLADVILPPAIAGIEVDGTAYRMDHVPLMLKKVIDPPEGCLPDRELVKMILDRVRELKARSS
ncbi:MAG: formylmethanofuran dehydrogenase subunit B [Candidatus Baldrarchaeia archaeon]